MNLPAGKCHIGKGTYMEKIAMDRRDNIRRPSNAGILKFFQRQQCYNMLVVDASAGGVGCLFVGEHPPRLGAIMCRRPLVSDLLVHVRWVKSLGRQLFRVGVKTPDSVGGAGLMSIN